MIVIGLGGNAISKRGDRGGYEEQYANIRRSVVRIADIIELGYSVVITHGNGPQVGATMLRYEAAKATVPPFPLHVADAETQGFIGYMIQQALISELRNRGMDLNVATIITQVVVDRDDPAFKNPSKPIGPFYDEDEVESIKWEHPDWVIVKDSDRGYRRVVPSPDPKGIVEINTIRKLVMDGNVVIACGGGGIPVVWDDGVLKGVDAVIDKDLASERLATYLGASKIMFLTDVDGVYINYNKPDQRVLREIDVDSLKRYYDEGHFMPGSMAPKVKAVIRFIEKGGEEGIIGHLDKARENLTKGHGTHVRGF